MSPSREDYVERLFKTRQLLEAWHVDAIIVSGVSNCRWLSGFTGSSGQLLISKEHAELGTDFRYWQQARLESPEFRLNKIRGSFEGFWASRIEELGLDSVAVESDYQTLTSFGRLSELTEVPIAKLSPSIEPLRAIKSFRERSAILEAARISDQVLSSIGELLTIGISEKTLAWKIERRLRAAGADEVAFPIIVASGPNSAMPHHSSSDRLIEEGEPIIIDLGAKLNGYNSDITRSFCLGRDMTGKFSEIYAIVKEAHDSAKMKIRPGMSGKKAYTFAWDVIERAGYGDQFGHGLGHGIGLDVHELPRLSPLAGDEPLPEKTFFTIEPGIYIPDWGGIRIEDLYELTSDGAEAISQCPYEPMLG